MAPSFDYSDNDACGGKIVEQGAHKELLQQRGCYYEFYNRQYEGKTTAQILS